MPKKLTKEQMQKYQQNRRAWLKSVNPDVKPVKPIVKPSESVKPDILVDVQQDINNLTAWCEQKGIQDDWQARIANAIHYQQYVRAG